jgi:hypothetical protein
VTTTLIRTQIPLVIGLPDASPHLYLSTSPLLGPDDDRLDPRLGWRELFSVGGPVGTAKLSNAGVMTTFRETKHFPNTLLDGRGALGDVLEICAIPFVLKRGPDTEVEHAGGLGVEHLEGLRLDGHLVAPVHLACMRFPRMPSSPWQLALWRQGAAPRVRTMYFLERNRPLRPQLCVRGLGGYISGLTCLLNWRGMHRSRLLLELLLSLATDQRTIAN